MKKFNALGQEVLALKEAISTPYPDIVLKSLLQTANDLLTNELIDVDIHYLLTEPTLSVSDFEGACLEKDYLLKDAQELLADYEKKRLALVETLNDLLTSHDLTSKSYLEKDCIMVIKTFSFGEEKVMSYFGVSHEDLDVLMRRKGFVEKFAALRMKKVIHDFLSEDLWLTDLFTLTFSPVFYDESTKRYGIELIIEIALETFDNHELIAFANPIEEVVRKAETYYQSRFIS